MLMSDLETRPPGSVVLLCHVSTRELVARIHPGPYGSVELLGIIRLGINPERTILLGNEPELVLQLEQDAERVLRACDLVPDKRVGVTPSAFDIFSSWPLSGVLFPSS